MTDPMTDLDKAVERVGRWANYLYTTPDQIAVQSPISTFTAGDIRTLLTALSAQSAKLAKAREAERAWAKLAERPSWEISFNGLGEEDGWTVHCVTGGVNDREWSEMASAATPLEAILQALGETND